MVKIIHFTIKFRSKNLTHFMNIYSLDIENNMLSQHSQKPFSNFLANLSLLGARKKNCTASFLDTQELHSWSTLRANVCVFLYISVRKFCSWDVVRFNQVRGWAGERQNNFLKAAGYLGLVKYFPIFHFNLNSTIFLHFNTSICSIKTLKFSRKFGLQGSDCG